MTDLSIETHWQPEVPALWPGAYSSAHMVRFNDRVDLPVDAAPDWGGDPANTNPEQALAASLSSCHMTTILTLATKSGWPVGSHGDHTVACWVKHPKGQMPVTRIDLHPDVRFEAGSVMEPQAMDQMQDRTHRCCFVANTLAAGVEVNIIVQSDIGGNHGR
nr:OsmC family protein [Paracoccus saliphilus]